MSTEPLEIEVTRIATTTDKRHANVYLAHGWKLLRTALKRDEDEYVEYVFGWTNGGEPDYPQRAELR